MYASQSRLLTLAYGVTFVPLADFISTPAESLAALTDSKTTVFVQYRNEGGLASVSISCVYHGPSCNHSNKKNPVPSGSVHHPVIPIMTLCTDVGMD